MTPGKLDQRVTFERSSRVPDGGGGGVDTWSLIGSRAANVHAVSGRERDMAQQAQAPRNYRITVRRDSFTASVTEADRLVWRGKVMNIRLIRDDGPRPMYLEFGCEAGVPT